MEAKYGVLKAVEISSREQVRGKRPVRLKVFVRGGSVGTRRTGTLNSSSPQKLPHACIYTAFLSVPNIDISKTRDQQNFQHGTFHNFAQEFNSHFQNYYEYFRPPFSIIAPNCLLWWTLSVFIFYFFSWKVYKKGYSDFCFVFCCMLKNTLHFVTIVSITKKSLAFWVRSLQTRSHSNIHPNFHSFKIISLFCELLVRSVEWLGKQRGFQTNFKLLGDCGTVY